MAFAHVYATHRNPPHPHQHPSPTSPAQQAQLNTLAEAAAQAASERLQTQRNFAGRIHDLLPNPPPKGAQTTLGETLAAGGCWQTSRRFNQKLPNASRQTFHQLSANIAATERSIDEVALIERAVQR